MNEQEVIARQAVKIEQLEVENAHLKASIHRAILHMVCIGGPLNDNKLGCNREQLATFQHIHEELDA